MNNNSSLTVGGAFAAKALLATQTAQGIGWATVATKTATVTLLTINPVVAIPAAIVGVTALAYFLCKED